MATSVENQMLIDQLPDEMLVQVFEMCDSDAIKNGCLVSQRWNTLIGQSLSVMEKLPLQLSGCWLQTLRDTSNFSRKYHTIVIKDASIGNENAAELLREHGSESRCIKFEKCVFGPGPQTGNATSEVLKSIKNVEKITFDACDCGHMRSARMNSVELPRLKSIFMKKSLNLILDLFKSSQLTSLKLHDGCRRFYYAAGDFDELLKFLATQKKLEELALGFVSLNYFELSAEEEIEMPLKRLSLYNCYVTPSTKQEQLVQFLSRFARTLEELELRGDCEDSVFELIFKQFLKLKVVMIRVQDIPTSNAFYHNLRPKNSVKKLDVVGSVVANQRGLEGFIGNMPNLETLALRKCLMEIPVDFMIFVSNNLRHLSTLHLSHATGRMFDQVRMPNVKALSFQEFLGLNSAECNQVVSAFTNIETFSLQEIDRQSSISLNHSYIFPKCWANLSHVKFGLGLTANKRIFVKLLRHCKKIKTVEMAESDFKRNGSRDLKKEGLHFFVHSDIDIQKIFPGNEHSLWINEKFYPEFDVDEDDNSNLVSESDSDSDSDSDYEFNYVYFDSDGEPVHSL